MSDQKEKTPPNNIFYMCTALQVLRLIGLQINYCLVLFSTVVFNIDVYSNYYWQIFKYVYFKFTHPADKFHYE